MNIHTYHREIVQLRAATATVRDVAVTLEDNVSPTDVEGRVEAAMDATLLNLAAELIEKTFPQHKP